jgi:hypothetical protein
VRSMGLGEISEARRGTEIGGGVMRIVGRGVEGVEAERERRVWRL